MWRRASAVLAIAVLVPPVVNETGGATEQVTFGFTGAIERWVVPAGVTTLGVELRGAQGGGSGTAPGGLAARVLVEIPVTPGEMLVVTVGGRGPALDGGGAGGFNGGANGAAAGGGGASALRRGTATGDLVAVAGGGGGAAGDLAGGDSGHPGGSGGLSCRVWSRSGRRPSRPAPSRWRAEVVAVAPVRPTEPA